MNEHTPGPWSQPAPFSGGRFKIIGGTHLDTRQVAVVGRLCDAYLVAAAPDLLAACQRYLRDLMADRDCHYDGATNEHGEYSDDEYSDDEDRMAVEQYDREIDALRALLQRAQGGDA